MRLNRFNFKVGGVLLASALVSAACGSASSSASSSSASAAPSEITVGTLYAGSGSFADQSLPEYDGLKFWVSHENSKGGVYVAAYKKRIPVKLVAYNDQSSPATAATLYDQLVTQNKVNIFVSDFGSVLTAPAATIAEEHHMVLFDQSGTGTNFFTPNNPYIVLADLPTSALWPKPLVQFLIAKKINKVALVYGSNDFDGSQDTTIVNGLKAAGITPVYNQAIPTTTSSYGTTISAVAATHPDAVIELGYANNDIAFLSNLASSGTHFKMVFTVFPGQLQQLLEKNVGESGLAYTYTYAAPPLISYNNVNFGMGTTAFEAAFQKQYPGPVNAPEIYGYHTGLTIQLALNHASSISQLSLRSALMAESGKITTLEGLFKLNSEGAQVGELLPVAQLMPTQGNTNTAVQIVYPSSQATASAVYPAP
ncbi:branched-chain amino acid transport system substrate-binding protein [Ferrithrix thermotolerans DSM 19514]|uniref:Branched-chain amino acid transport system substrate-binding protein n=1 Tax=Ferrithrix thermotolerans DSM 19514 TaxID=1121881 RepID=A0A1M4S791_9ACTN|nr:ABC transporter substrate-binding protein [Ferrithrix thermotolerans]SHE28060.1 branched-chain amino acid transport system substrate-binding protein [Ferrithrix thermotolerans DSM 19514]